MGDYDLALSGFINVIRISPDYAIAYFFAALCNFKLGNKDQSKEHLESYIDLLENKFWRKYIKLFNLPTLISTKSISDKTFSFTPKTESLQSDISELAKKGGRIPQIVGYPT